MTVKELITLLQTLPQDHKVAWAYPDAPLTVANPKGAPVIHSGPKEVTHAQVDFISKTTDSNGNTTHETGVLLL
jgi:hypothetical protein